MTGQNYADLERSLDLDHRAEPYFHFSSTGHTEKDLVVYASIMKRGAFEFLAGGFSGDPDNLSLEHGNRSTNFGYIGGSKQDYEAAANALASLQEWDQERLKDRNKTFEIRFYWSTSGPRITPSDHHTTKFGSFYWLARLDVQYIRSETERRSIAIWFDTFKHHTLLSMVTRLPRLLLAPHKVRNSDTSIYLPDFQQDFSELERGRLHKPLVWFELPSPAMYRRLADYLETVEQQIETLSTQSKVGRLVSDSYYKDPLTQYRPSNRQRGGKPKPK